MADRLFGLETEYAFTALNRRGNSVNRKEALMRFMELARSNLPHLPDASFNGMFLENGSRFYLDHGLHPEMSTPECATPWDLVRYVLAGERILARLGAQLEESGKNISQALLFKCNVDYRRTQSTWGCHESYLHRVDPALLPGQIVPHLVSRIVFTGAGGFNSISHGLEFTLSPRVPHLTTEISEASTHDRGIFHTKDESLSRRGYHRLHILCGESLGSELAAWLKVGTTALIVAMVDAGLHPGDSVQLLHPLEAMRLFAIDTECKAESQGKGGRPLTAGAIQRHYLNQAEAHVDDSFMPPWAEAVCREWRRILDLLETGSAALETTLDWKIKLALCKDRVARRGMTWESLSQWTAVLGMLQGSLRPTPSRDNILSPESVGASRSLVADEVRRLAPGIKSKGLNEDDIESFLALRQELFEIDTRFGQLGDNGIFSALDRAGVLTHHAPGVDDIDAAVVHAPAIGRARLRGEWIRRLAGAQGRHCCDWGGVWDPQKKLVLDLSNPFENKERWVHCQTDNDGLIAPEEDVFGSLQLAWRNIRSRLQSSE